MNYVSLSNKGGNLFPHIAKLYPSIKNINKIASIAVEVHCSHLGNLIESMDGHGKDA